MQQGKHSWWCILSKYILIHQCKYFVDEIWYSDIFLTQKLFNETELKVRLCISKSTAAWAQTNDARWWGKNSKVQPQPPSLQCSSVLQNITETRSSWLNCALRDDEAVHQVSIGHYEAVAVGTWWYWVSRGHSCLYILHKVEIWSGVTDASLTTLKDRATQLFIKYKRVELS